MSLDPALSDAELMRIAAERTARREGRSVPPSPELLSAFRSLATMPAPARVEPITLRIPWSCLVSDNRKHVIEKGTGKRFKTNEYKGAKARIRQYARDAMQGRPAPIGPLSFVARVWMPDRHRRDVLNFGKCTIDSLSGICFADDSQLHDVRWIRAGVDVDSPRAEIVIEPLLSLAPSGFKLEPFPPHP